MDYLYKYDDLSEWISKSFISKKSKLKRQAGNNDI